MEKQIRYAKVWVANANTGTLVTTIPKKFAAKWGIMKDSRVHLTVEVV